MSSNHPDLSSKLERLGTETAYAVAGEAKALAATGAKVFPMHIGDLNFPTPECIKAAAQKAISENKTGYVPAAGIAPLREAVAGYISRTRNLEYGPENVSIQPGGKPVIGKFLAAVLEPGDEVMYPSPGYPIYESQVDWLGGTCKPYGFIDDEGGFRLDLARIEELMTPQTKVFIYNNFANPVGVSSSPEEMAAIARLCVENDVWVLSDEAYWNITYDVEPTTIASYPSMFDRTVILFTCSKSWSMTGWRCGAAIGPSSIIDAINKFNTNLEACTANFVQWAAVEALTNPEAMDENAKMVAVLRQRRDALVPAINDIPGFHCHKPESTFYLFIRVTQAVAMTGCDGDLEQFRRLILNETGVSFCTREHFGRPIPGEPELYIRFAYSGIDTELALEGCQVLKAFMESQA